METPMFSDLKASKIDLRRALRKLSRPQYDAVIYCYILEYTQAQSAQILGRSQPTISINLRRAKANLKKLLS